MTAASTVETPSLASDLMALIKPRISVMVLLTTAGGLALGGGTDPATALWTLLGMWLVVGSANTLNCWLERDIDGRMERTATRPLPAGRMEPNVALVFGLAMGATGLPMLYWLVNPLSAYLAAIALGSYVCIYTPMKQISPSALLVGSVPGALPPLIGWTAVTGSLDWAGIALFGVLFFWQLPHFIAIAIFRKDEYAAAGFKVLPAVRGVKVAKIHAAFHAVLLLAVTFSLVPLNVAGAVYLVAALGLGIYLMRITLMGFAPGAGAVWARKLFGASLVYLPLLFAALAVDALI